MYCLVLVLVHNKKKKTNLGITPITLSINEYLLFAWQAVTVLKSMPRINCSQMKLPDFESPSGDSLSKSANFGLSKWIFYVKNHPNLSKKKFTEEYQSHLFF